VSAAPSLVVNHQSTVAPYEQISLQIRVLIAEQIIPPGMLLPPVRQLAEDLGVAPNTVIRAYDELERDGWVTRAARKNVAVAEQPPPVHEVRQDRLAQAVAALLEVARLLNVPPAAVHTEIDRQLQQEASSSFFSHERGLPDLTE
jgi:GntR family transcriptional regulator